MRIERDFFLRDVLVVAPALIGMKIVRILPNGEKREYLITETEAYRGEEDLACHASKGRTPRTEIMYHNGGVLYVYLIYGMYWMLNIVVSVENNPQAVLIRGVRGFDGPGKAAREMGIDKSFNGEDVLSSERIFLVETGLNSEYICATRVGVDYAGEVWKNKPWRYILKDTI